MDDHASQNRIVVEGFEWHTPSTPPEPHETHSSRSHYARLTRLLPALADIGITSLWLPPGCKAMNRDGNGYDIYDLWDLGEFNRHGCRSTKWGSKEELVDLMGKAKEVGVDIVWDAVLNHRTGADAPEETWAVEVDKEDRRVEICPPRKIEAWLRFDFPAREQAGMPYSRMRWNSDHFNGADWDHRGRKKAIYKLISDPATHPLPEVKQPTSPTTGRFSRLLHLRNKSRSAAWSEIRTQGQRQMIQLPRRPGKGWADDVDEEHGNNDFLMLANIDYTHPEVRQDVLNWGAWMIDHIGASGFRLDAVRHISFNFIREFIKHVGATSRQKMGKDPLIIGEVWAGDLKRILAWMDRVQDPSGHPQVHAFDAPLLYNFSHLSEKIVKGVRRPSLPSTLPQSPPDLRTLLQGTLVQHRPNAAVTLVTNHDTQTGQESSTAMDRRLKPLFYAFILLRREGLPCVFWGDIFGIRKPGHPEPPVGVVDGTGHPTVSLLVDLMMCRKLFAYGTQTDLWESPTCIAWTRNGDDRRPGCVVVLSIQAPTTHRLASDKFQSRHSKMKIGNPGEVWFDVLRHTHGDVTIDALGFGFFPIEGPGISVFVSRKARGIDRFPVLFDLDVYNNVG